MTRNDSWLGFVDLRRPAAAALIAAALGMPAFAQNNSGEPERFRGVVTRADVSSLAIRTAEGKALHFALPEGLAVFALSKASFADVDFGLYVGAVSERMGDTFSPIYRDSLSWLHKGFELRIIDESLRGIAVGHSKWDLTPNAVITHGWIDDLEDRVLSIKYGPTDQEETDVEISRDTPILRMSLGDKTLVKAGARVLVGAQKAADGSYAAVFVFVGKDGIVPPL